MPSTPRRALPSRDSRVDVTVLFLEGGHASTGIGPLEVFRDAGVLWPQLMGGDERPCFRVRSASIGRRAVRVGGPYRIQPEEAVEAIEHTDLVFVPSAGLDLERVLARSAPVIALLQRVHARGGRVAGVCSGVSLLAEAGLLEGCVATTHWALVEAYRERFPGVRWDRAALVTECDRVYCGGGVHAALDLALYLVERLAGREIALECSRSLLIDMPRPCQAGFAVLPMGQPHDDATIRRAEEWIQRHCRENFRFEALARELGMSPRNFIRRFKHATGLAPMDYLQRLRVTAAKRLLEDREIRVADVSAQVGYEDGAFFRALFKRHTGLAPSEYRRQVGADGARSTTDA